METVTRFATEDSIRVDEAGLSVVIPAYNEAQSVGPVVESLLEDLAGTGWPFEIIVVDDGSTDGTGSQAESTGVRVIRHQTNRGYGAALKTGIRYARHRVVCITDADGTYPNERIPELVARLEQGNSEMVVGARTGAQVAIPTVRRPAKWAIGRLADFVSGEAIPDLNSGLRVFSRKTALRFLGLLPNGFSFTATITLALLSNGYWVEYVPINYGARKGRSKFRPVQDTFNFMALVLRIALYFAPLKVFLLLSGLLLLLAVGWGMLSKFAFGALADVSTMIIVMASVQVAVLGLLAELINRRLPNLYREED